MAMAGDEDRVFPHEDNLQPLAEIPFHRHPLYNSVVLANLFKMVPRESLANYFQVCKVWYNHSIDLWRGSIPLSFNYYNIVHPYSETDRFSPLHNLLEFVEDPRNEYSLKPYRQLRLNSFTFKLGAGGVFEPSIIQEFYNTSLVGDYITTLTLADCEFRGTEEFRNIIFKFFPNLGSLSLLKNRYPFQGPLGEPSKYHKPALGERLNLKSISIEMSGTCGFLPVTWFELFSHFPSLSSFTFNGNNTFTCGQANINKVLRAIKLIQEYDIGKLPLKDFDIQSCILLTECSRSRATFELLQQLKINIRRLHILMHDDIDMDLLKNIVRFHASSLVSIAQMGSSRSTARFPFGVWLEHLESLSISVEGFCEDMEFLKYTPNLAKLEISKTRPGLYTRGGPEYLATQLVSNTLDDLTMVKLKELKFDAAVSGEATRRLIKWFPNVTSLTMVLNDETFAIICEHSSCLTSLVVLGRYLTDNGIVGKVPKDQDGTATNSGPPNILNLQSLTYFSATSEGVTDVSVFHGFLKLPNLLTLKIPIRYEMQGVMGNYRLRPSTISENARMALELQGKQCI